MRYWFDTEFIEDGRTIDLLSIGIVSDDYRELYLEISDADHSKACDWVKVNVLSKLGRGPSVTRAEARDRILAFVGTDEPEFWAYYADYDWVALCQLFGRMIDLPAGWPMFCRDLKQLAGSQPLIKGLSGDAHHALADARWTRSAHYRFEADQARARRPVSEMVFGPED